MEGFPTFKGSRPWPPSWPGSGHTAYRRASIIDLYLYKPNFSEIEETFCGRTYVRMYVRTNRHLKPTLLGWLKRVDLKIGDIPFCAVLSRQSIHLTTFCKYNKYGISVNHMWIVTRLGPVWWFGWPVLVFLIRCHRLRWLLSAFQCMLNILALCPYVKHRHKLSTSIWQQQVCHNLSVTDNIMRTMLLGAQTDLNELSKMVPIARHGARTDCQRCFCWQQRSQWLLTGMRLDGKQQTQQSSKNRHSVSNGYKQKQNKHVSRQEVN